MDGNRSLGKVNREKGGLTFAHSDKVGAKSAAIFGLAHSES